jgi:hypothetical protein
MLVQQEPEISGGAMGGRDGQEHRRRGYRPVPTGPLDADTAWAMPRRSTPTCAS